MTKLITEIKKYKIINCPQTPNLSGENYQDLCAESHTN